MTEFKNRPTPPSKETYAGLYVHIPFCVKKCPYCDFYSITDISLKRAFLNALEKEIYLAPNKELYFDSIYVGGGTPSILTPEDLAEISYNLYHCYQIMSGAEITLEVNPGTVSFDSLKGFRKAGVNRINIGVQSFIPAHLEFLGRIHSDAEAKLSIQFAFEAGFENIGMDLIYGLPGQTKTSWLYDLKQAVQYKPKHLSCYMLTCEPGTLLDQDRKNGLFQPLNEFCVGRLFKTTKEFLASRGYNQYEISNFVFGGSEKSENGPVALNLSRHNLKYWSFAPYIGFGPSAHSFKEPVRYWNHRSVQKYIADLYQNRLPVAGKETLDRSRRIIEALYLGLRQTKGIDIEYFTNKFGADLDVLSGETIGMLKKKGMLKQSRHHYALTSKGMLFLDTIVAMLIP